MTVSSPVPEPKSFQGYAAGPAEAGPGVRWAGRSQRSTDPASDDVRPDDVAALRRPGPDPFQVLMFGEGALSGVGLRDHNLGLPGHVADSLAIWSGRGVDLDVFGTSDPTSPESLAVLRALRLQRYDAVVVVIGVTRAARRRTHHWEAEIAALAGLLSAEGADSSALLIVDSSRAVRAHSGPARWLPWGLGVDRLGPIMEAVCARTSGVRSTELELLGAELSEGGRYRESTYRGWADQLVQCMRPALVTATERVFLESAVTYRSRPDDETLRRAALQRLGLARAGRDEFLDGVVRQLRQMYDADAAAVHFLDGDELWSRATTDAEGYAVPQQGAICATTLMSYGLLLVNDVGGDPWFQRGPAGELPAFYAGYPIRTWDGYRVGTLCITDTSPRSMRSAELAGLRDFAGRVEQHLWQTARC